MNKYRHWSALTKEERDEIDNEYTLNSNKKCAHCARGLFWRKLAIPRLTYEQIALYWDGSTLSQGDEE